MSRKWSIHYPSMTDPNDVVGFENDKVRALVASELAKHDIRIEGSLAKVIEVVFRAAVAVALDVVNQRGKAYITTHLGAIKLQIGSYRSNLSGLGLNIGFHAPLFKRKEIFSKIIPQESLKKIMNELEMEV